MRYVALAVIIGTLVVSLVVFVSTAAAGDAGNEAGAVPDTTEVETDRLTDSFMKLSEAQNQAYQATLRQKELESQLERRRQEAVDRFGQWGPELVEAAEAYGQDPAELYRVMYCESKGDPYADNGVNKGLFQFHPGTFAGTPYGSASIYDGRSQIFAAAWMWSQGRQGEWTCF